MKHADTLFSLVIAGDGARPSELARMSGRDVGDVLEDLVALQAAGLAEIWSVRPTARGRAVARKGRRKLAEADA